MEGYLGRGPNDWAVLADRDNAARLRTRVDHEGAVYYGTDDDKWLSVGTVGANKGYVGLYGWKTTGYPPGTTTPKAGSSPRASPPLRSVHQGVLRRLTSIATAGPGYAR